MKRIFLSISILAIAIAAFIFSGCSEPRYYHTYNHHSRGWYDRRHTPPPAGVNFEIDVRSRRHHRY